MAAPQPNMEEILSSIRSSLEEETSRVGQGEDDTPMEVSSDDVLVLEDELSDEELLALSDTEGLAPNITTADGSASAVLMVNGSDVAIPEEAAEDEVIDLQAFTASGALKGQKGLAREAGETEDDVLGMNLPTAEENKEQPAEEAVIDDDLDMAAAMAEMEQAEAVAEEPITEPVVENSAESENGDEAFDKLLDEIKQEKSVPHEQRVAELLGDDEPAVDETPAVDQNEEPMAEPAIDMVPVPVATRRMELPAIAGESGLQVALPSEILAEALRPLIRQWLSENLPDVVERLVKEEIAKLNQG